MRRLASALVALCWAVAVVSPAWLLAQVAAGGRLSHPSQILILAAALAWTLLALSWRLAYASLRRRSITFQEIKVTRPQRRVP